VARFVKGDIIVVPFPFSDLTQAKRRPALVISALEGNDLILCQITSQSVRDNYAILLDDKDFNRGSLKQSSNIRPNRIFTADNHIVLYRVGDLKLDKINKIIEKVIEIIRK
jgi:mRNA-degrading endonuclease toxin of MazEF toxin-antitoxin module